MTKIVYDLLLALEQCDDTHNRCDYLMEHNEITYLLEYITNLRQENKQLKDNWNKIKEIAKSQSDFKLKIRNKELWFEVDELLDKMQELEKSDSNE